MRRTALTLTSLALLASLVGGCERKRKGQPDPSAKPISPAVVEPLPAPRGQPKVPRPTGPAKPKKAIDAGAETDETRSDD